MTFHVNFAQIHTKVAEADVYPNGTPEGWGCPAISNNTLKVVDALIRRQNKRMLIWIYVNF